MFPPASLAVELAAANFRAYSGSDFGWMLRRFVISPALLNHPAVELLARAPAPSDLNGVFAVVSDNDHVAASSIESKVVLALGKPTYCEVPEDQLYEVMCVGSFAKIRTGGVTPESIPTSDYVASFIHACARHRIAFKATAGLHHPLRSVQPLTYEADSPRATLHGFINILLASAFACNGAEVALIRDVLNETDSAAFGFDDTRASWRGQELAILALKNARKDFIHSFGSCSFTDPVDGLRELNWL
jgi:hypothetical protein